MANSSRNPNDVLRDAEQKGYSRILFQQGKPVCDFELTLLGDLSNPQRLAAQYIGSGVPAGSDGFAIGKVNFVAGEFSIKAGRCLVSGREVVLLKSTTYKTQPHRERVQPFPAGSFNVYLRVFPTEITDSEDADLGNKSDVGTVTAVREKTDWEVLVSLPVIDQPDHFLLAVINSDNVGNVIGNIFGNIVTDRRRKGLTMAALRDELDALGGTGASLSDRLNTSLNPDGTLKNEIVNTAQLAKASVNEQKLAINAVNETTLATNAVSKRTIQDGAISIAKLDSKLTLDLEVKVPRATFVGTPTPAPGEVIVGIQNGDEHAFLLISVRVISPKTILDGIEPEVNGVRWMQRSAWITSRGEQIHQHQLILQNFNPKIDYVVACKAFRITEL